MKRFSFLLLLPVILFLENFQCGCVRQSCYEGALFRVTDAASGKDIFFGQAARFNPDSVYIRDKETWKQGYPGFQAWGATNDSLLHLYSYYNVSDSLYLSFSGDVDTIVVRYRYEKTDCCDPYYHIREIEYNGKAGTKTEGYWELQKKF